MTTGVCSNSCPQWLHLYHHLTTLQYPSHHFPQQYCHLLNTVTFSRTSYSDTAQGFYIRGISIADESIYWKVFKACIGFILALLVVQSSSSYLSIELFIHPVEKAATHLKLNNRVDIAGLVSVELFAKYQ